LLALSLKPDASASMHDGNLRGAFDGTVTDVLRRSSLLFPRLTAERSRFRNHDPRNGHKSGKGSGPHSPGTCPDGSRTAKYRYNYAHAGRREWKSRFTSVILEATVKKMCELKLFTCLIAAVVLGPGSTMSHAQGQLPPD